MLKLVNYILLVTILFLLSCKQSKTENIPNDQQNSSSENTVVDSKPYKVTTSCRDNIYIIDLDLNNSFILIQKNNQQFKIPAAKFDRRGFR